jgi:hypothetical protein
MSGLAPRMPRLSSRPSAVGDRLDDDAGAVDLLDDAVAQRHDGGPGVAGDVGLHAGADQRGRGAQAGDGLALHVRAHEGAVGVVVLEERDERGGDRDQLARRDVHQGDLGGGDERELLVVAARHLVVAMSLPLSSVAALAWAM